MSKNHLHNVGVHGSLVRCRHGQVMEKEAEEISISMA